MSTNGNSHHLTLLDAVDALSTIAEADFDQENFPLVHLDGDLINWKDPTWLYDEDKEEVKSVLKDVLKVILDHFKGNYSEEETAVTDSKTLDGIKTIMVLVGEAAKKIDHFTRIFNERKHESLTKFKEYRQLQDFYQRKISRTIDEALLGKWILALTERNLLDHQRENMQSLEVKHVFVDFDTVKRDIEYELFFIRKDDSSRFFSPRLIRNIKLTCDFGSYLGKERERDPLIDIAIWEDQFLCAYAEGIKKNLIEVLTENYPILIKNKHEELGSLVHETIVALFLATSKIRLMENNSSKSCSEYFADFQMLLRKVLHNREFQQIIALEEIKTPFHQSVLNIVNEVIKAIFIEGTDKKSVKSYIHFLLAEGYELISKEHRQVALRSQTAWSHLGCDYAALQKLFKHHLNGPLNKILHTFVEGNDQSFDPYHLKLLPEKIFQINGVDQTINFHTLPSPTSQDFINKAFIIDEFQHFLRVQFQENKKVLLINFQDSTSWREFARAQAIESLHDLHHAEGLTVVTLPKDTEFYKQELPFSNDHQLDLFKEHFLSALFDRSSGFYIPWGLHIDRNFASQLFDSVDKVFFSNRNVLSKESRLDFIEIFYLFLEMKFIEASEATNVYFVCKDGVDISTSAGISLYLFLTLLADRSISEESHELLSEMLVKMPMMQRQRTLLPERFQRLLSSCRVIENVLDEHGREKFTKLMREEFGPLFNSRLLA